MRFTKRALSALLALVMVFTMLPLQVWAEEVGSQDSDNSVNLVGMYGGAKAAEPVAARVELDEGSAMIAVGGQHSFTPKLISNLGEPMEAVRSYHWKSDHPEIATVDNGVVTGVAEGIARITCVYDDLETTAVVTVTQATYQVTYEIEYPQDAKKVAYMNGGAATIITPQNTKITISCAPGANVVIPSNLASAINYDLIGFRNGSNIYTIGEAIDVSSNITLKSCWKRIEGTTGTEVEITVRYNYESRVANKQVKAFVVEESDISGRATFITANNNDTFASDDPRMCGWTIGGENYGLNQQVTVPVKRENRSSEWIVDAYARLEAVGNNEAYAEFFVRKSDKVGEEGFGADKYFSVGSRKISTEAYWNTSTRINGAENVSKYLSNPPTAEEVANLMNESLPAGAVVEWNHLSKLNTGYHVDGVIRTVGKYWNVKFIDPDTNVCLQQVPVMDEGTIPAIYNGNALNTSVRTFKGWSFQPEGEIVTNLAGKTINGDITLYAVFERKPAYTVKAELYVGTPNQKGELLAVKVENDLTFDQLCKMYEWKSNELATHFWKSVKPDDMHSSPDWYPGNADAYKQSPDEHVVKLYLKKDNVPSITAILTYNGNVQSGTVNNLPDPVKTIKGEAVRVSGNIPIREGYTFRGWNTNANGNGTPYSANDTITLNENTTLYAQWTANTADYTVQYLFQKADGSGYGQREDVPDDQGTGTIGQTITPNKLSDDKIPAGFAFGKMDENVTIAAEGNAVAKVYYDRKNYNISYELEGDVKPEGANVPNSFTGRYGAQITIAGDLSIDGYTFTGWYTKEGAPVQVTEEMSAFTMPAGDVTLYGKFSKRTNLAYTVKYYWIGDDTKTIKDDLVVKGQAFDTEVILEDEQKPDIDGFTLIPDEYKVKIGVGVNVVNVYYYKNVTLTANSDNSRIYNGESQSLIGYTASVDGLIFEGVGEPTVTATNAGEYPLTFVENPVGQKDSTGKYIVAAATPGKLTINPKAVELSTDSASKDYDGTALTKEGVAGKENFVAGDVTEVRATGTQTLVGESKNTIEITWKDETVEGNYEITKTEGTLKVTAPGDLNDYVAKTHEDQNFKVGDKVTFNISVTNIYAVNAKVTLGEMDGMTFENGLTTLEDVLDPGETKIYTATHTLTDADFENGVNNTVEVMLDPEGEEPEIPGTGTDEVELEKNPNMSVVKTVLNPKESYRVGDTIQYQIIVTNTGNVTLHDLRLTDVMNADGKVTFPAGTDLTKGTLAVGETWTVRCSYVVREADEGKVISNKATVIAHDPETKDPEKEAGDTTDGEKVQNLYSLTIHYRNGAGTAVAPSFQRRYHAGDRWKVVSPIVAGYYEPHTRSISSDGMPAKDLVFVVTYVAIPAPVDPDPERPNPNPSEPDEEDDETVPTTMPETELPPEPADFTVDPDDYTLTEVEDNETPLANMDLDGHTCCIMHLLLMLAAMVVLGFYTKSRKKHQARIFELKRILAAEEDHPDDPQQP